MSDSICEELIVHIFKRLPSKSLLRFRSLSKSLCSIISSPDFIRMHTFQSPPKLLFKHSNRCKNEEDFYTLHGEDELPLCLERGHFGITPVQLPFGKDVGIVGSYNGILCLYDYLEEKPISLWNPSIRCKLTLPDFPQRCFSRVRTGFGFDPITQDYKIVSIYNHISFVYAMKVGTWCAMGSPTPTFHEVLSNACFVNGSLHWVVEVEPLFSEPNDLRYILTFDLSTHVFGRIALPKRRWETLELTTIKGSLAVICHRIDCDDDDDSWLWVRRNDSWSLVFKLETDEVQGRVYRVLQLRSPGDLLFNTLCDGYQVYNRKVRKIRARSKLVDLDATSSLDDIVLCSESLSLVRHGDYLRGRREAKLAISWT